MDSNICLDYTAFSRPPVFKSIYQLYSPNNHQYTLKTFQNRSKPLIFFSFFLLKKTFFFEKNEKEMAYPANICLFHCIQNTSCFQSHRSMLLWENTLIYRKHIIKPIKTTKKPIKTTKKPIKTTKKTIKTTKKPITTNKNQNLLVFSWFFHFLVKKPGLLVFS